MQAAHVLTELQALGSESIRKTYRRHGAAEPLYGVKHGDLGKLVKRLGRDHDLAGALWRSEVHDARLLATMIADPARFDAALAEAWLNSCTDPLVVDALAPLLARSPAFETLVQRWTAASDELTGRAGWSLVSALAAKSDSLSEAKLGALIVLIERGIHAAPNRARQAMHRALIAVGSVSDALAEVAIAAARRIGKVEIDVGDTACEIPDAEAYIRKTRAYQTARAAKLAKPARRSPTSRSAKA